MFDSIELQQSISDMFDAGVKDDNLALIYKANEYSRVTLVDPSLLQSRLTP